MQSNYVDLEQLTVVLEWLKNQRPDSALSRFSLFRVDFEDPQTLGSTLGAAEAMARLNRFGRILASTVRCTDLVARKLSVFWILTPECNRDMVTCRLCELSSKIKEVGLDMAGCSISVYSFPIPRSDPARASLLLDRLEGLPAAYKFDPAKQCPVSSRAQGDAAAPEWHGMSPDSCSHLHPCVPTL